MIQGKMETLIHGSPGVGLRKGWMNRGETGIFIGPQNQEHCAGRYCTLLHRFIGYKILRSDFLFAVLIFYIWFPERLFLQKPHCSYHYDRDCHSTGENVDEKSFKCSTHHVIPLLNFSVQGHPKLRSIFEREILKEEEKKPHDFSVIGCEQNQSPL